MNTNNKRSNELCSSEHTCRYCTATINDSDNTLCSICTSMRQNILDKSAVYQAIKASPKESRIDIPVYTKPEPDIIFCHDCKEHIPFEGDYKQIQGQYQRYSMVRCPTCREIAREKRENSKLGIWLKECKRLKELGLPGIPPPRGMFD